MFIILESNQHVEYKNLISEFHDHLFKRDFFSLDQIDRKNAIYFIALDQNEKYIGGAYLIKRSSEKILINTRLMAKHLKSCKYLWECGGVHLVSTSPDTFAKIAPIFYPALYKHLADYSKKKHIHYMCVHNTLQEKENIQHYGNWPMVGQIIDVYKCNRFYSFLNLHGEFE